MQSVAPRDIHSRKRSFQLALANLKNDDVINQSNRDLILDFINDCSLGKTVKKKQKKRIGPARCLKYIQILKRISGWLGKPFDNVEQSDMEKLITNLENDIYQKINVSQNRVFADSTKLDYKNTLRKFYKWLFGNNTHYPELVDWIDTREEYTEVPALSRDEVERLLLVCNVRDKAIIMTLFDSGARAEELLNIRLEDLKKENDCYKVRIRISKTKPRTIHLPLCTKYIDIWLQEIDDSDDQEYLFSIKYDALRQMIHRVSKKVLKKRVTPHILRHSSATYYANHLSHYQLCYRYGWTMASKMPNRYLDREGIFEKELPSKMKTIESTELEKHNTLLNEQILMLRESNNEISQQLNKVKDEISQIKAGKGFMKLLMDLTLKQKESLKIAGDTSTTPFDVILQKRSPYLSPQEQTK
ncbi:site-specific integrase [bacterium]|nr:site-specific integrase [bacterium]